MQTISDTQFFDSLLGDTMQIIPFEIYCKEVAEALGAFAPTKETIKSLYEESYSVEDAIHHIEMMNDELLFGGRR